MVFLFFAGHFGPVLVPCSEFKRRMNRAHRIKRIFALVAAMVAIAGHSDAAVLAKYDFTGSVRTSSDTDLNSTASSFSDGAGWVSTINTNAAEGNPAPALSVTSSLTSSIQAHALSGNDYYEFTITPATGFELNLTSLTFDYSRFGGGLTATFFVRSSADSFGADLGAASTSSATYATATISLASPAFQHLTSALTIRLYIFDDMNNSAKGALVDNVVVNGNSVLDPAPVPEPSLWTSFMSGVALLVGVQRFRRRKS